MRKLFHATLLVLALLAGSVHAQAGAHIGRHVTTPEDTAAITQVTVDFQKALINKDEKGLSTLMFNSSILFVSPAGDAMVKRMHAEKDVNFDGLPTGGYVSFARFVGQSTKPFEEKFYNTKITQDGDVAWVMFDFEVLNDNKVANYGVETWQLCKVDGKWKIFSVVWSSHGAP